MSIDKDKITEFAEKTGEVIIEGVKAGVEYTKEKAPLVGDACLKFGRELKDIFTSDNTAKVVDIVEPAETEESTDNTDK